MLNKIGTGLKFGRKAFIDIYFPCRVCDQRVREYFDTEPNTEELKPFCDMPNATIEKISRESTAQIHRATQLGASS